MNRRRHATVVLGVLLSATACFGQLTPDGTELKTGEACYTMTAMRNGVAEPIGQVFQSIQRAGTDALAIVVHQRLSSGKFDMRDSFVVRRSDLRPIRLDSERNGAPHVHLDYVEGWVRGWKTDKGTRQLIDVALDGPAWDGNLWGVTFAALPLRDGADYRLAMYQYDSGKGGFIVKVAGKRKVETPKGSVEAWVLQAGTKADELVEYLVAVDAREELGYSAGPMSQHLGGDCAGLR